MAESTEPSLADVVGCLTRLQRRLDAMDEKVERVADAFDALLSVEREYAARARDASLWGAVAPQAPMHLQGVPPRADASCCVLW